MTPLPALLLAHRRRIRSGRAAESFVKAAFWASIAACAGLILEKIAGAAAPRAWAAAALLAVPVALALRAALRLFSIRDCAVHLDRLLGLDERLATALEATGPMAEAVAADADGALSRATLPRRRLPREARFLAGSGLLALVLLALPAPPLTRAAENPALEVLGEAELRALESMAKLEVGFREAKTLLEEGRLEESLAKFEALRERLAEKLLEAGGGAAEARDAADAAAKAIVAQLQKRGKTVHAPRPRDVALKLARQAEAAAVESAGPRSLPESFDARGGVPPRYEAIVKSYFRNLP